MHTEYDKMKICNILILLCALVCQAQYRFLGVVIVKESNIPIPFATIRTDGENFSLTDIDGKFSFVVDKPSTSLQISYPGYEMYEITSAESTKFYTIELAPKANKFQEIMLSGAKRGYNIIKNVIANKPINDPQQKLKTFEFKAYNKLLVTANPDSIEGKIDTIFRKKTRRQKAFMVDSSEYKFKKIISQQHLFQTERVSQFQYRGKALKETILGTKMAGLKQPIYEILAVNLQSFSIYDQQYELLETKYRSPISISSVDFYQFRLIDSVKIENRTSFLVYFKDKKKSRKAGLEGVLFVDAERFAINKAIMRSRGVLDISGTHEFKYYPEEKLWFPSEKIFRISKGINNYDIRILGETLYFDTGENTNSLRKKEASDYTYLLSETRMFDVSYNNPITIKNPFQRMELQKDSETQKEEFWTSFRKVPLDERSKRTYVALDSISLKTRIEKRLFQGRKILNGYIPFGFFDFDLRDLISFNNYEGFRFGLGGKSSDAFSKRFRITGYTAYGTKDGRYKYNLGVEKSIDLFSNSWIGASYTDDLHEVASSNFATEKRIFKLYDPRPFNLKTFYNYESYKLFFETKLIPKTESVIQLVNTRVDPLFDYVYNLRGKSYNNYTITTTQVALQWNPFSDYLQTPGGRIEVKKRFPKFTIQYNQTIPRLLENDFQYNKIDFRIDYEKKYVGGQKSSILFESAFSSGELPLTHAYNTSPNNLTNDRLIGRITIAGKNSFETMFFNEFFSSEFVMIHIKHSFPRIEFFRKVKPSIVLVSRAAWGKMQNKARHVGLEFNTLEKGYFESGFELNQIYSLFGISAFYRYGPYQLNRFEDNLAIKLTFNLNLGF